MCSSCGRTSAVPADRLFHHGPWRCIDELGGNEPFTASTSSGCARSERAGQTSSRLTQARTLIVDDTPGNCLDNYGNAITVSSWDVFNDLPGQEGDDNSTWQDKELAELMLYLDSEEVQQCPELHKLDKSDWRRRVLKSKPKLKTELEPSDFDPCRPMLTQKQETRDLSLKLELKLPSGCFNPAHKCSPLWSRACSHRLSVPGGSINPSVVDMLPRPLKATVRAKGHVNPEQWAQHARF